MIEQKLFVIQCTVGGVTFPTCVCRTEVEAWAMADRLRHVAEAAIAQATTFLGPMMEPAVFSCHEVPLADVGGEFERALGDAMHQHVRRAMDLGSGRETP
jgi:hypothetical protein